jgi:hypothetical protein
MFFLNVIAFVIKYIQIFSGSIPNVIFVAYVILKRPHNELSIRCMTLAYLYNECSTFVKKINNCIISLGSVIVNGFF